MIPLKRCLLLLAAIVACYAQQPYLNLDFETSTRGKARSWSAGGTGYEIAVDQTDFISGTQSLRIRSFNPPLNGLGTASQLVPLQQVRGKHLRVSGWIKTSNVLGYAAIWMRVDGTNGFITLDNMSQTGPYSNTDWTFYQYDRDVSANGVQVVFGVFLSGSGTAWFDALQIEVDGTPLEQGPEPYVGEPTPEQLDWVRKTAIPVSGAEPGLSTDDLKPLKNLIGNARIVGLGEDTHGTSEFFRMKHRLVDYLANELGFTVFAIEANMPEAYAVNDFVLNGRGDPKQLLKGMYFWTWNTQEVLDMILWMREFNKSGKGKIQFVGFDMQTMAVAAGIVRSFVSTTDPEYLGVLEGAYKQATDAANLRPSGAPQFAAQYDLAAKAVIAVREYLASKKAVYAAKAASYDVEWAIQNSRIVEQAIILLNSNSLYRDRQMAANINWIVDQAPAGSKVVLWAHNGHVQKANGAMGSYLASRYGNDYVVLGFAFHDGRYNANGPRGVLPYDAAPSFPGSAEYVFHQSGVPQFILDLRKAAPNDAGSAWLLGDIEIRSIGALPVDGFFVTSRFTKDYDAVIYFDQSHASALLPF
jgi:erythromycin esterase